MEPDTKNHVISVIMTEKQELLAKLKQLVETAADNGVAIKQEIDELFPGSEHETRRQQSEANQRELTEALTKLKITQATKMPKFQMFY